MTSILAGIAVKLARSLVHIQQVTCATVRYQLPMLSVSEINTLPNAQLLNQLSLSIDAAIAAVKAPSGRYQATSRCHGTIAALMTLSVRHQGQS